MRVPHIAWKPTRRLAICHYTKFNYFVHQNYRGTHLYDMEIYRKSTDIFYGEI